MKENQKQEEGYDYVNPSHYNKNGVQTIDKIEGTYGTKRACEWCLITAFKYIDRIGEKPNEPVERELGKINWYFSWALQKSEGEFFSHEVNKEVQNLVQILEEKGYKL